MHRAPPIRRPMIPPGADMRLLQVQNKIRSVNMRSVVLFVMISTLAACTSASLERQAGAGAKQDCMQEANDYLKENMATIANEKREYEKYKYYQKCLWERQQSES